MDHAVRCATHLLAPRSGRKMSCAQEAHVSTRATRLEVVTHRAEPPMAGQVVRKAPAKEAKAAGTAARAAAAAMESLWSVARGTIPAHKVEQWQSHRSKLPWIRFGEAGTASPARLVRLTCQRKHRCIMSCCGSWYGSQGLLLACRLPAARVIAAGARHASPASLHDLQGSRVQVDVNSPSARRAVAAKPRRYFENK